MSRRLTPVEILRDSINQIVDDQLVGVKLSRNLALEPELRFVQATLDTYCFNGDQHVRIIKGLIDGLPVLALRPCSAIGERILGLSDGLLPDQQYVEFMHVTTPERLLYSQQEAPPAQ